MGAASWDRNCNTYGTCGCLSPTDCTAPEPAVVKLTRYRTRIGTSQQMSSKSFMTMNWIHISTRSVIWTDEACFTREDVFVVRKVTSGHWIMLSANVGIKSASALAFGMASSGTLSWARTCYRQANSPTVSWFYWNYSTGAAWKCACSCEAEDAVSSRRSSSALWRRRSVVVKSNICRNVDWTWRTDCMASLVAGSNSLGFLPVGTPEGGRLSNPSRDCRGSRGKTLVSVSLLLQDTCMHQYLETAGYTVLYLCVHVLPIFCETL
jgi:hypothetical protein